jgi:nucleotide-binding universal stress UspA family protein
MLSLPRILAPIDFSPRASKAARFAGRLASRCQSELTLLHVLDSNDEESGDRETRRLSEGWRLRADGLLANLLPAEMESPSLRRVIVSGSPAGQIGKFAHRERISLLVIPTHGGGPLRPLVLGSVTTGILREADCPVLTGVHLSGEFPDDSLRFRRILCAVDLGSQGEIALEWASRFAGEFDAQLTVAHITPSTAGGVGEYFDPERRRNWVTETRGEEFAAQARQKVEVMMRNSAGTSAAVLIQGSVDVPQTICGAASRLGADLVVIGRGVSGSPFDRLRTKACTIIRQSPCPVLSVVGPQEPSRKIL